jgi:hypothetical protein
VMRSAMVGLLVYCLGTSPLFAAEMQIYLLALPLTGNDDKAERCFISALDAAIEVDLLLEGLVVLNAKMA